MIIKFDHITYVASREQRETLTASRKGLMFQENDLANLDIKAALMQYPQEGHDLYFYDDVIPTEYIFYDRVGKETSVSIRDGIVHGSYFDKEGAIDFLTGIFGRKVESLDEVIRCNMKGILEKKLLDREHLIVSHLTEEGCRGSREKFGIEATQDNLRVVQVSQCIVLAVKPQCYQQVIRQIRNQVSGKHLIISIAPGKTIKWLEEAGKD